MLEHQTPLEQCSGSQGQRTVDGVGLRLLAVRERGLLLLQGDATEGGPFHAATLARAGVRLPAPQLSSHRRERALLWLAPKEWLLELPAQETEAVHAALAAALAGEFAAVTDVSDALAGFDVSATHGAEVLMTGCSLDLGERAFAPGQVARTLIANVSVILWKLETSQSFRCWVDRSWAHHFSSWIAQSR